MIEPHYYEDVEYAPDFDPESEAGADWPDDPAELADVLRDALHEDYSDASLDELDEALGNVLEEMSPAESFNFATAMRQIERGGRQALAEPAVGQILRAGIPAVATGVGTVLGGPVGGAVAGRLGTAAASALPPAAGTPSAPRPVTGGSAAAAQGLVLTQQPDVLKGLLALAMGGHGKRSVNGVPVAQLMGMLSSVFGQAAADADELMYLDQEGLDDGETFADDAAVPSGRSLYTTLLDADNEELAEAVGSP